MSKPAQIGWFKGERFVSASASLKDVSLTGVSAISDVPFRESSQVWLTLNDHPSSQWVKAVVVEVKRTRGLLTYRRSPYLVRMRFGLGCPYTFFRAAVGSPEPAAAAHQAPCALAPKSPVPPPVGAEGRVGATQPLTRHS